MPVFLMRADLKHVGAVGNGERHVGVLLHQQDGGPGRVELLDDVEDLLHQDGGQAHGGLVEHEQVGLAS